MTTCGWDSCHNQLTERSPSLDFCSLGCQVRWQAEQAEPLRWGTGVLPGTDEGLAESIRKRIAEQDLGGAA